MLVVCCIIFEKIHSRKSQNIWYSHSYQHRRGFEYKSKRNIDPETMLGINTVRSTKIVMLDLVSKSVKMMYSDIIGDKIAMIYRL